MKARLPLLPSKFVAFQVYSGRVNRSTAILQAGGALLNKIRREP